MKTKKHKENILWTEEDQKRAERTTAIIALSLFFVIGTMFGIALMLLSDIAAG